MTIVKIKPVNLSLKSENNFEKPHYQTSGSAGFDLYATISEDIIIKSGEIKLIPTGIAIELELGYEGQIRPRSGLALKHGITVLNSPGTIDSDYRGEIAVILINHSKADFIVKNKMRIAQMIIAPYIQAKIEIAVNLQASERGEGGFGSTGVN